MSEVVKCKVTFPSKDENGNQKRTQIRISQNKLTFTIGNIKCRTQAIVYFKFYGYDYHNHLITEHTSEKWVITNKYDKREETFDLTFLEGYSKEDLDSFYMELHTLGIDSENPLYFNRLQLNKGNPMDYHTPREEIKNVNIGFYKNKYINLYDDTETFLQIIRPNKEDLSTEQLTTSQMTILAPHIENESKWDNPIAIFYEFMYMNEQKIGVEK